MLVSSPRSPHAAQSPLAKPPSYPTLVGTDPAISVMAVATAEDEEAGGGRAASANLGEARPSSPLALLGPAGGGLVSVDSLWAAAAMALVVDDASGGSGGVCVGHPKRARSGSVLGSSSAELGEGVCAPPPPGPPPPPRACPQTPAPRRASRPPPSTRPSSSLPCPPERLVARWESLPTAIPVPGGGGTVVSLRPGLWRAPPSAGGGAVVTLSARVGLPAAAQHPPSTSGPPPAAQRPTPTAGADDELSGALFSCFNPRVVTSGVPGRPGRAEVAAAAALAAGDAQPSSPTPPQLAAPASVFAAGQAAGRVSVVEVVLVRRPPCGSGPALDLWHLPRAPADGAESGALPGTPLWPGEWLIDVAARVTDGRGGSAWVRLPAPMRLPATEGVGR